MIKVIDAPLWSTFKQWPRGVKNLVLQLSFKSIHDQLGWVMINSHVMRRTLLFALGFSLSLLANMEESPRPPPEPSFVKSADTGRYCWNTIRWSVLIIYQFLSIHIFFAFQTIFATKRSVMLKHNQMVSFDYLSVFIYFSLNIFFA